MDHGIRPQNGEGVWLWLAKIIAGLLIFVFLGLHFIVNHLLAPNGLLSYEEVVTYYRNPIIPIIEVAFLIVVVFHALVGLRSILIDLNPSRSVLRSVSRVFWVLGFGAVVYGLWLVRVIVGYGS